MKCELHQAEMVRDRRYTTIGVFRCGQGCILQDPAAGGTKVLQPCALDGCTRPVPRVEAGRPRRFCSTRHRKRAYRLRRRWEQVTEV